MDLEPAKTLLAGAVTAAAAPGQRFVWGRWSGTALYLEDAPDTPIDAGNVVNAAGPLMPGQLVLCLVEAKPHRITIIGPPGQATSGSTGRGSWVRRPDRVQERTTSGDASAHAALLRGLDVVPRTVSDPLTICATAIGRWRN